MRWGWGRGGLLWSGGLQLGPWYVAGWPLVLSQGHSAAGLTPLDTHTLVGWVVAAHRGPIQEPGPGFQDGGVGLQRAANEMFPQLLPLPPDER